MISMLDLNKEQTRRLETVEMFFFRMNL